jgi:hypothetical protein
MYNTFLLDRSAWDLVLDSNGNIAMAQPSYAVAQDVASAIRLFLGELYYDTTKGVPYWSEVLGQMPPVSLIQQLLVNAAISVTGVKSAQVIITAFDARTVTGYVQYIDENGEANGVSFN